MNNRVWIISSQKTDGRYNKGKVVGIDSSYPYLDFQKEFDFLKDIEVIRYKVAYVDCVTGGGCVEWFLPKEISKTDPTKPVV